MAYDCCCAVQLGLSWAIAGSRIVDNKHNPSDVVVGFFLGASVAVVFLLRSIPCLKYALNPCFSTYFCALASDKLSCLSDQLHTVDSPIPVSTTELCTEASLSGNCLKMRQMHDGAVQS